MPGRIEKVLLALTSKRERKVPTSPLLLELLDRKPQEKASTYEAFPFAYEVAKGGPRARYQVYHLLSQDMIRSLRSATREVSEELDPEAVEPLTFGRLVEVLTQLAAANLDALSSSQRVKELTELVAYEAIGLSRVLALAKDEKVTEFFVDSDSSPVYVDHLLGGRCETDIVLTEREKRALETHADTFSGYTLDYRTPSVKNDLQVSGARLRVSLDLEPLAVNKFSLDVRRLNVTSLTLSQLVELNVVSEEGAAFLVAWLSSGGNITIVGETGTGKTTLLNAIDELVEPRLRRLYIEDAVESLDMLSRGFHQMKVKVDPFERGDEFGRTKESEIVKALHRSPDLVILGEIQSQGHSRAFFHALAAGARGMQTFHASTVEQAIRRWVHVHGIPEPSLVDLGLLVQMGRPDKLKAGRFVVRICKLSLESGAPRVRDIFTRDRSFRLLSVGGADWASAPPGVAQEQFQKGLEQATARIAGNGGGRA